MSERATSIAATPSTSPPYYHDGNGLIYAAPEAGQSESIFIADVVADRSGIMSKTERANAEFIGRACNAFQDMLEALEAQQMAEYDREASIRKGYFDHARQLRERALAKAKGGAA